MDQFRSDRLRQIINTDADNADRLAAELVDQFASNFVALSLGVVACHSFLWLAQHADLAASVGGGDEPRLRACGESFETSGDVHLRFLLVGSSSLPIGSYPPFPSERKQKSISSQNYFQYRERQIDGSILQ